MKHINLTPNIIETLSKYVLYTWEAYIHFGGTFLKPALQIFFKTFEDGHFGQKTSFFPEKIFEPPNFLAENIPTATKLCPDIRSILNLCQKNLCDHLITIDEKIWKKEPPPYGSSPGGGLFLKSPVYYVFYLAQGSRFTPPPKDWGMGCVDRPKGGWQIYPPPPHTHPWDAYILEPPEGRWKRNMIMISKQMYSIYSVVWIYFVFKVDTENLGQHYLQAPSILQCPVKSGTYKKWRLKTRQNK